MLFKKPDRGGTRKAYSSSVSGVRVYAMILLIFFFGGLVFLRLYSLQIIAHAQYKENANSQHKLKKKILPLRGEIFLQEKDQLFSAAINRELFTAFAIPKEIENIEISSRAISDILDLEHEKALAKLSKQNDLYEVLKRKLSAQEVEQINNSKIKGIYLESESWRYYPGNSLAAQIVGFVGSDGNQIRGQYGIESSFENLLRGGSGLLEQEHDTFGRWISVGLKSVQPARNGKDVVLTVDHVLQFKTELALKNAVERHSADSGKIIIVDPSSGKILAMAVYPSFDPNDYSNVESMSVYKNAIISDAYECGSVFKPITMASGLDMGKVSPESTYFDSGQVTEAGFVIKNSDEKSYGNQTMTNVIEKSLNTGAIYVQRQVGNQHFKKYIEDFGFGKRTEIDIPGETKGNISNLSTNRDIEFFTASFGQGITVTPLQLAMAYSVMANGGDLYQPVIVEKTIGPDGGEEVTHTNRIRSTISKRAANQITLMLESNVKNGHGKLAGVPGYRIAGKTGTAQIPDKEKGGYLEDATTGTFAGYGPAENPIFSMVVIIDYPKDVEWAESTAAPVFGEISKFMFDYYGIEPSEDYSPEDMEKFSKTHNYLAEKIEAISKEEDEE